jgi:hypothetical protein
LGRFERFSEESRIIYKEATKWYFKKHVRSS